MPEEHEHIMPRVPKHQAQGRVTKAHKAHDTRADMHRHPGHVERARLRDLDDLDRRSRAYKRARKMTASMVNDLGGEENVTDAQRMLIRRAIFCEVLLTDLETRWASGEEKINVGKYVSLANAQNRAVTGLGVKRIPKDATPNVDQYLAAKRLEARRDAVDVEQDEDDD